jgi:hypothetical protein
VAVKLITVRNYAPMVAPGSEPDDEKAVLDNLIDFLVHLSMRMRLDRLDGVAEIGWATDDCLVPMIEGFFQGLDLTGRMSGFPDVFPEIFGDYFNLHDETMLMDKAQRVAKTVFEGHSEERGVIDRHMEQHFDGICRIMANRK